MEVFNLYFSECEHGGDLERYEDDVRSAGGTIVASNVNPDEETGIVTTSFSSRTEFMEEFKKTDSFDFYEGAIFFK